MPPIYRIRGWDDVFENSETRKLKRLRWVPVPVHHDGDGYCEIMDHDDGVSHYGCWIALLGVAGKCEPRGVLQRSSGEPHTPETIARIARISPGVFRGAWERVISMGWLEVWKESPEISGGAPEKPVIDEMRWKGKKGISSSLNSQARWPDRVVEPIYDSYPRHVGRGAAFKAIRKALDQIARDGIEGDEMAPEEWLLGRTRLFASACRSTGKEAKYIPHPATFYNQARYDDDESEWKRA